MKTSKNVRSGARLVLQQEKSKFVWHRQFLGKLTIGIIAFVLVVGCHHPPVDPLSEPNPGNPPKDSTGTKPPKDSTGTPPKDSTGTPPKDSTVTDPNGPVSVFKSTKISYSSADFQEIQYDADGTPVQYISQYVNNQGTGSIQRFVYQFQYNADKRLDRVNMPGSSYIQYVYEGNKVARTEEYSLAGHLVALRTYTYSDANQLIQIDANLMNSNLQTRETYQYDGIGNNLTAVSYFVKNAQSGNYSLEHSTHYENYDTKKTAENLLAVSPFLPTVTFRINNYRTKVVRYKDGSEISRETYDYVYNEQDYPTQRVRTGPGGTLTTTYSY